MLKKSLFISSLLEIAGYMWVKLIPILLTLLWLNQAIPAVADLYSYTDKNGVVHFSNVPASSKYQRFSPDKIPSSKKMIVSQSPKSYPAGNPKNYDNIIKEASKIHGVSSELIKAVIQTCSAFNSNTVSPKGAMGLMQLMPETSSDVGVSDPFDPRENIMGGTRYLKELMDRYGSVSLALAAYQAGPNAVEKYKCIPPFRETENFVEKVLQYYSLYQKNQPVNPEAHPLSSEEILNTESKSKSASQKIIAPKKTSDIKNSHFGTESDSKKADTEAIGFIILLLTPLMFSGGITGIIAFAKGRSFLAWFVYGFFVPLFSQLHAIFCERKRKENP